MNGFRKAQIGVPDGKGGYIVTGELQSVLYQTQQEKIHRMNKQQIARENDTLQRLARYHKLKVRDFARADNVTPDMAQSLVNQELAQYTDHKKGIIITRDGKARLEPQPE